MYLSLCTVQCKGDDLLNVSTSEFERAGHKWKYDGGLRRSHYDGGLCCARQTAGRGSPRGVRGAGGGEMEDRNAIQALPDHSVPGHAKSLSVDGAVYFMTTGRLTNNYSVAFAAITTLLATRLVLAIVEAFPEALEMTWSDCGTGGILEVETEVACSAVEVGCPVNAHFCKPNDTHGDATNPASVLDDELSSRWYANMTLGGVVA
ncbi:hypothetical protein L916_06659 [Phytophthora nicotianae]|uniref:Uncharacterized protein n=3 Tax=Phytophthora nicotianae TaxID=4792 RepID=V9FEP2_PHYNI|nr:hypothetical protein F443_06854 [Phytophthora nicotianae P1569]ETL42538.1 hypothetical protein L916_06659 [Phytophthora nicotianae]